MNYGYLKEEFTDDNEIKNDKELRKIKKKLRSLKQKEDIEGSRKLEILINEYENINKTVEINKTNKKTQKKKTQNDTKKESDSFLEKEYQKNKAKNAEKYAEEAREKKRKAEADEEQRREKEKEKEHRRREEREYNREYHREYQMSWSDQMLNNHGLKRENLPSDILEIIENYSHSLWKKLSLKYHPDKYDGNDEYSKFLNCLKDENK
jgi:hypothetical protein